MMMSSFPAAVSETEGDQQDEAFYAELKRQILSLTDGDDDGNNRDFVGRSRQRTMSCDAAAAAALQLQGGPRYYSLWGCECDTRTPVPAWLSNIWRRDEKGTGVFIPYIVRMKQKPAVRKNRRTHKRVEKKKKTAV